MANFDFTALGEQGYSGSINDRVFKYLGDLGYTGGMNDRLYKYYTALGYTGGLQDMIRAAATLAGVGVNEYKRSLGLVTGSTPYNLFQNSEVGFWYDPSDIGTTFGAEEGDATAYAIATGDAFTNQSGGVTSGLDTDTLYYAEMTITNYSAGDIKINTSTTDSSFIGANSTFSILFTGSTNCVPQTGASGFTGTYTLSVKEAITTNTKMFQDHLGETPVTGVGQTVGLMLDKSQGAQLGTEEWTGTITVPSPTWTDNGDGSYTLDGSVSSAELEPTALIDATDKTYKVTGDVTVTATGVQIGNAGNVAQITSSGSFSVIVTDVGQICFKRINSASVATVSNISVKEIAGSHATQATEANRPILQQDGSGNYYLDFDGTNDYMVVNGLSAASGPITAHFGYVTDDGETVAQNLLDVQTGATTLAGSVTGTIGSIGWNDGTDTGSADIDTEALTVATFNLANAADSIRANGSVVDSGTTYDEAALGGTIHLGASITPDTYLDGKLYQAILRNTTSTAEEIDIAEKWVGYKTGVAI